jgi:predicted aspartyl protease
MATSAPLTLKMKKKKKMMMVKKRSLAERIQQPIGAPLFRVLNTQVQQPDQLQRHNLFQIFFIINNRRVRVIIDGGSCINLVRSELIKKLGLTTRPHQHPYHIQWLNDLGKAKVTQTCRISFSIGSRFG